MRAWWIDPLSDQRWVELVDRHPRASVFHTRGWLESLRRTYRYEPIALTTTPPDRPLSNAIVFCRVESWLTGRRLVSLPFSDHCEPIVNSEDEFDDLMTAAVEEQVNGHWKYVEIRPAQAPLRADTRFSDDNAYCIHRLDLRPAPEHLLLSFHKNHVVRKIRRGEREGLEYQEGTSPELLGAFYDLLVKTRSRHGLPPQPRRWFRAILDCPENETLVRLAFKDGIPAAGMVTMRHRDTVVYKYGASDEQFHRLGAVQYLFWRVIRNARAEGSRVFDFGRSALSNAGLVAFKDHWGAARLPLVYLRFPRPRPSEVLQRVGTIVGERIVARLPERVLVAIGGIMYRHIA
jgi:hypothetical protein